VTGKKITNLRESARLLDKVRGQRSLLQISIPGVPEVFFSFIINISLDDQFILLDELSAKHGHELLLLHKRLNIQSKVDGIGIQFSTNLISSRCDDGIPVYKVEYPQNILYFQKRQNYRINLGLGTNIPIKLKRDDGTPMYGKVFNLSESGAGIALAPPYTVQFSELVPYCEIRLSDNQNVTCQLEIRYANSGDMDNGQKLGGKFIGLSGEHQRVISKTVINLQRDMMRHIPKSDL